MIVWALFDSGNGCYTEASKNFSKIEIYPIGMDIENKNNHFLKVDLADYSRLFGDDLLFKKLDQLPSPDLIIASPPCESFSVASAMWGGNASWKQEQGVINRSLSKFTIRNKIDYDLPNVRFKFERSFLNRINGELCIFNTIEIIKRYRPSVYIIENPSSSRIWNYIDDILDFKFNFDNLTYYSNYNYPLKKPTKFKSNINLGLKTENKKGDILLKNFSKKYNERSNIPISLINEIYASVEKYLCLLDKNLIKTREKYETSSTTNNRRA